jgi:branched-chain amino acid transport system permease protein
MSLIGQLIFDGLAMGLVFVILAGGMVLITSVSKILFMAYGMFYTVGAYAVWFFVRQLSLPYFVGLPLGLIVAALVGILCYILIFKRLQFSEGGFLATLIGSMGLLLVLGQGGLLIYGTVPRSVPNVFNGSLTIGEMMITFDKLALIGMGVVIVLILFWVYEKTNIGRAMRAVSFKAETASLMGVNTSFIYMMTLGLGTALAGFAGGILAPSYGINPQMGSNILWTVILMCMLGGMDSLLGAVLAGALIGQMLSFGQYFIGGTVQIAIFVIIGIILYFRPQGLLGKGIDIEV